MMGLRIQSWNQHSFHPHNMLDLVHHTLYLQSQLKSHGMLPGTHLSMSLILPNNFKIQQINKEIQGQLIDETGVRIGSAKLIQKWVYWPTTLLHAAKLN